jgi:hypothetical protein
MLQMPLAMADGVVSVPSTSSRAQQAREGSVDLACTVVGAARNLAGLYEGGAGDEVLAGCTELQKLDPVTLATAAGATASSKSPEPIVTCTFVVPSGRVETAV